MIGNYLVCEVAECEDDDDDDDGGHAVDDDDDDEHATLPSQALWLNATGSVIFALIPGPGVFCAAREAGIDFSPGPTNRPVLEGDEGVPR